MHNRSCADFNAEKNCRDSVQYHDPKPPNTSPPTHHPAESLPYLSKQLTLTAIVLEPRYRHLLLPDFQMCSTDLLRVEGPLGNWR